MLQPPNFYDQSPPAPPGLIWWHFAPGVPPLPDPPYPNYGWRYDPNWHPTTYVFNNMDRVRCQALPNHLLHLVQGLLQSWPQP
jgi:hypothetical protein